MDPNFAKFSSLMAGLSLQNRAIIGSMIPNPRTQVIPREEDNPPYKKDVKVIPFPGATDLDTRFIENIFGRFAKKLGYEATQGAKMALSAGLKVFMFSKIRYSIRMMRERDFNPNTGQYERISDPITQIARYNAEANDHEVLKSKLYEECPEFVEAMVQGKEPLSIPQDALQYVSRLRHNTNLMKKDVTEALKATKASPHGIAVFPK